MNMADKQSAFVVKERLEGLEKLVDKVLEVDGLKELAKDTTKHVLDEALESSKVELREVAKSTIQEAKDYILSEKESLNIDVDKRLDAARSDFQKALVDHLANVEARQTKAEKLLKVAIALAIVSAIWSGLM
jgi:uncharacterized ubiquitin-like protein YukD